MYDEPWHPHFQYDEARHPSLDDRDRIVHLVHLDGLLIDAWSEPVENTRWEPVARRVDRNKAPAPAPRPPEPPAHERLTSWLRGLVGGADPLASLGTEPLAAIPPVDLDALPLGQRHRIEGILARLEGVRLLDDELEVAVANAIVLVHDADPTLLTGFTSAAHAAGGLIWAVGKANGRLSPEGTLRQKDLTTALGLASGQLSGQGRRIESVLAGAPGLLGPRPYGLGVPDLLALGTPQVLASGTRRLIVRLREQAIRARDAHAA